MINASFRKYDDWDKFIKEYISEAKDKGCVTMIIHCKDYQNVLSNLCSYTMDGKSLVVPVEIVGLIDDDILTSKEHDNNMFITLFDTGTIVGEPALYTDKAVSFLGGTYFVEKDAADVAVNYAISSRLVPFMIDT